MVSVSKILFIRSRKQLDQLKIDLHDLRVLLVRSITFFRSVISARQSTWDVIINVANWN